MIVRSTNKWDACKAYINTWLKDPRWYCNSCGKNYGYDRPKAPFVCCEDPQVGRNIDHTRGVVKQNKAIRESRKNDFASDDKKTIRYGLSLPPALMRDLEKYFVQYGEPFLRDSNEMAQFMKAFPQFTTCRRI